MLSLIYAAEVQYRHDSAALARENHLLVRIAERALAAVAERALAVEEPTHVSALRLPTAWPRPIHATGPAYSHAPGGAGATVAVAAPCY